MAIVTSTNLFAWLGAPTPAWFNWLLDNKLYGCMMIFFIVNAFETQLISTGAFEISVDDIPVWSKIESGRIPQPSELFQIVDNHFRLNTGGSSSSADMDNMFKDEL
jgi:selT/selW/selH-like putative selenoprotein